MRLLLQVSSDITFSPFLLTIEGLHNGYIINVYGGDYGKGCSKKT